MTIFSRHLHQQLQFTFRSLYIKVKLIALSLQRCITTILLGDDWLMGFTKGECQTTSTGEGFRQPGRNPAHGARWQWQKLSHVASFTRMCRSGCWVEQGQPLLLFRKQYHLLAVLTFTHIAAKLFYHETTNDIQVCHLPTSTAFSTKLTTIPPSATCDVKNYTDLKQQQVSAKKYFPTDSSQPFFFSFLFSHASQLNREAAGSHGQLASSVHPCSLSAQQRGGPRPAHFMQSRQSRGSPGNTKCLIHLLICCDCRA